MFPFHLLIVLTKQAERKVQEEQTKLKTSKTRKRKLAQKVTEGTPPTKRSSHSLSTSPSHPPESSASMNNGEHVNGDFIDVVGNGESNHIGIAVSKLGKRSPQTTTKRSRAEKRRSKVGMANSRSLPSYNSPSNSFPNSPISVSSSALNNDHTSSPRASPFPSSVPPQILLPSPSVTPPRKHSKHSSSTKRHKSLHH